MAGIKADYTKMDESIERLGGLPETQAGKPSMGLSFRGDFPFTKAFEGLNALMEQNHMLWYNVAGIKIQSSSNPDGPLTSS